MNDLLLVTGFLVLAALQVALHVRLARVPDRAGAALNWALLNRAGADARAIQEGAKTAIGDMVEPLVRYRDQIESDAKQEREVLREMLAAQHDLNRERSEQTKQMVQLARTLRASIRKTHLWERELAELVSARVPILRPPPLPCGTRPDPTGSDDPAPTLRRPQMPGGAGSDGGEGQT